MNNLHNIVVYIKDEIELNYLYLPFTYNSWGLSEKMENSIEITLAELEQLLKQNRDENTSATR